MSAGVETFRMLQEAHTLLVSIGGYMETHELLGFAIPNLFYKGKTA
jgi:hypothetical protein